MENKVVFGIMNILFNACGVPDFMQGKTKAGILKIVLSLCTCSVCAIIYEIKGIITGIKVLKMSDAEYAAAYLNKAEAAE